MREDLPLPEGPVSTSNGCRSSRARRLGDLGRAPEERVLVPRRRRTTGPSRGTLRWATSRSRSPAREGSWDRIDRSSTTRSEPGSSPSSLPSIRRAVRIEASASACRPPLYWASARISHRRSLNGSSPAATVAPAATLRWSPVSRRAWSRSSTTASRSSFSRMASSRPASHSSSSANGRPCHSAEGLLEESGRPLGGVRPGVLAASRHQRLELLTVDVDRVGAHPVAARHCRDGLGAEHAAKAADAALHDLGPARGRLLAPERVGQLLRRERVTRPDQQGGEHDPVTRAEGASPRPRSAREAAHA